jgi:hypothetical protein
VERDFKGIWIPKDIWLSEELTLQEKVFLVEIDSLDNEQGCYAGNEYFSKFFGLSKTRVSIVINSLVKKKYITSTIIYKEGTKQILKRVLKVCYRGYIRNVKDPMQEKFIESNTVNNTINNTVNNTTEKELDKDKEKEIEIEIEKNKNLLTPEQIENLNSKFPDVDIEIYIEKIKDWENKKNKKYSNYNLAIQNWIKKDIEKHNSYEKIVKIKEDKKINIMEEIEIWE